MVNIILRLTADRIHFIIETRTVSTENIEIFLTLIVFVAQYIATFFIVGAHMREDMDALYTPNATCYIEAKTVNDRPQNRLVMEHVPIMTSGNLLDVLMTIIPEFYTLHLKYPRKLRRTLMFFQTELLGINSHTEKDSVMVTFQAKLPN